MVSLTGMVMPARLDLAEPDKHKNRLATTIRVAQSFNAKTGAIKRFNQQLERTCYRNVRATILIQSSQAIAKV